MTTQHQAFPHYAYVNWLRAFAAFTVILYHIIALLPWQAFPGSWPLNWFRMGWMGVDLFFVISGFVIALSAISLSKRHPPMQARRIFMRRRFARIAPLYIVSCIAFVALVQPELLNAPDFSLNALTHALFVHNLHPAWHGAINGPTWSVAAEMQFYVLICLVMPWLARRTPLQVLAICLPIAWGLRAIAYWVGTSHGLAPHHLFIYTTQMPMMLDLFGFGIALALWIRRDPAPTLPRIPLALAATALCIAAFAALSHWASYWDQPFMVILWRSVLGLGVMGILALIILSKAPTQRALSGIFRVGHYLGDISYGLYLWHMPVLLLLQQAGWYNNAPLPFTLATFAITIALSSLSWHLLEQPMIRRFR